MSFLYQPVTTLTIQMLLLPRCMQCRRGLAMRILSVCPSVRPSVCLSIKRVICDKMEERSVQIFIPYERSFSLVFWEEEWLMGATPSTWYFGSSFKAFIGLTNRAKMIGGGDLLCLKFWIKVTALERNRRFSISFRSYSDSAVTPSEKSSINTNRKSTTRFPMRPRWTSNVVPKTPKDGSKTQCPKF